MSEHEEAKKRVAETCRKARVRLCQVDEDHPEIKRSGFGRVMEVDLDFLLNEILRGGPGAGTG